MSENVTINLQINDRIFQIIERFCGGNKSKFASLIGVSEGTIRNMLTDTEPKYSTLVNISRTFPVNVQWLLLGIGDMEDKIICQSEYSQENIINSEVVNVLKLQIDRLSVQLDEERQNAVKLQDALIQLALK